MVIDVISARKTGILRCDMSIPGASCINGIDLMSNYSVIYPHNLSRKHVIMTAIFHPTAILNVSQFQFFWVNPDLCYFYDTPGIQFPM